MLMIRLHMRQMGEVAGIL
ncbi:hypothetical protein M8C21_025515, partial [Ambrosia artemisiifolia]